MIRPSDIERVEVIKGPASALYGSNAMAGVINIITGKPREGFNGSVSAQFGSYKTIGTEAQLSYKKIENNRGYYLQSGTFYRHGDGYIY